MRKIGILVDNLSLSQLNFDLFTQINEFSEEDNIILFCRNYTTPFIEMNFPIMNINRVYSSYLKDYLLIATDIKSSLNLKNVITNKNKIFYSYSLEFLKNRDFNLTEAYNHIPVYTRSLSYKQVIDNFANINSTISNLDLLELWTKNT